jgi:hypothetical protein
MVVDGGQGDAADLRGAVVRNSLVALTPGRVRPRNPPTENPQ